MTENYEKRNEDIITDKFLEMVESHSRQKDFITGYYNLEMFKEIVDNTKDETSHNGCALIIFEIDGYTLVDDSLGRFHSDALLMNTSSMIEKIYHDVCMGRLYRDLFGIFMNECDSEKEAFAVAQNLREKIVIRFHNVICTLKMGVSFKKIKECNFDIMYKEAGDALFEARTRGKSGCVLFKDKGHDITQADFECVKSYDAELGIIMDDYPNGIYVADPVSYELLYLNKKIKERLNLDDSVIGQKCYKAMAGLDKPCEYCSNSILAEKNNYFWNYEDEKRGTRYVVKDSLKMWHGRLVRTGCSINVSDVELTQKNIESSYDMEFTLKQCINQMINSDNIIQSYKNILKLIGEYHCAEKACIYEMEKDKKISFIYDWYDKSKDNLVMEYYDDIEMLLNNELVAKLTNEQKVTIIRDIEIFKKDNRKLYDDFVQKGIKTLLFMEIVKNNATRGYIVIYNPIDHLTEFNILITMTTYIANEMVRQELWSQKTYELTHDTLTGCYNRVSYVEFINEIQGVDSLGYVVANINGLKNINENISFEHGDEIVVQIADIIKEVFIGYPVFRFDGDEFIICLAEIKRDELGALIEEVKRRLQEHECGAAIGYVWDDFDIDIRKMEFNAKQLLDMDKRRMYEKKNLNGSNKNHKIVMDVMNHISNNYFKVYLQPKFNMVDGKCCGAEALIRLQHPEYGLISPGKFIPILEKTGAIFYVDLFVFEEVCNMLDRLIKEGREVFPISFNFSKMTLMNDEIYSKIEEICSRYDVPRKYLEIEITESIGDIENDRISMIATRLHERGFKLSMDDFGTKYSSIGVLSLMRFDILKIDRSMVNNLIENNISQKVIKHIIAMCSDLDIECVAEGVETQAQAEFLKEIKCNIVQGYLYGKPMPQAEFLSKFMTQ